ncbi:MAG: tetratricopeptide repeat protein [Candidatus Marinimicrobia bacterium]|nr:tetratricopeptide repeat protein [Candidatus Neomarinimicrobiota bacterium]
MKDQRIRILLAFILISAVSIFLTQCVPPPSDSTEESQVVAEPKPTIERDKCELYLNFAYSYYQNQNWQSAIKNYKKMMKYGCEEEYAQDIYSYFGRAYQQLAKTDPVYFDSALFVFEEGEKYLPDDIYLKKNIAYIYHVQNKIDLEIREYEKIIELQPDDLDLYRTYVRLCFSQERYEDMLWGINKILEIAPDDQQAISDRMMVYERMGKDITTIQKEQWERNPTNVRFGLEYADALSEQLDYDKAIEVLKKVTSVDLRNKEAWLKLADLYKNLGKFEEAAGTYEHINKNIDSKDLDVLDNISKMYINLGKFETAYSWAKKAIAIGNSSLAYKIRADVLFAAAESCSAARTPISFEDKLVYKLAYDDYLKAKKMGDYGVQSRIDFLKEYLIPTNEDWFMNRYDANGKERSVYRPRLDCYNWIGMNVSKN